MLSGQPVQFTANERFLLKMSDRKKISPSKHSRRQLVCINTSSTFLNLPTKIPVSRLHSTNFCANNIPCASSAQKKHSFHRLTYVAKFASITLCFPQIFSLERRKNTHIRLCIYCMFRAWKACGKNTQWYNAIEHCDGSRIIGNVKSLEKATWRVATIFKSVKKDEAAVTFRDRHGTNRFVASKFSFQLCTHYAHINEAISLCTFIRFGGLSIFHRMHSRPLCHEMWRCLHNSDWIRIELFHN